MLIFNTISMRLREILSRIIHRDTVTTDSNLIVETASSLLDKPIELSEFLRTTYTEGSRELHKSLSDLISSQKLSSNDLLVLLMIYYNYDNYRSILGDYESNIVSSIVNSPDDLLNIIPEIIKGGRIRSDEEISTYYGEWSIDDRVKVGTSDFLFRINSLRDHLHEYPDEIVDKLKLLISSKVRDEYEIFSNIGIYARLVHYCNSDRIIHEDLLRILELLCRKGDDYSTIGNNGWRRLVVNLYYSSSTMIPLRDDPQDYTNFPVTLLNLIESIDNGKIFSEKVLEEYWWERRRRIKGY